MRVHVSVALVVCGVAVASCTNDDPVGSAADGGAAMQSDGAVTDSGGSGPSGTGDAGTDGGGAVSACTPAVNPNPDPNEVDSLTKAIGLWTWSKRVQGGSETPLDECDSTVAYRFGPAVIVKGTPGDFARCVLVTNGVMEVSAGTYLRPSSCAPFGCTPGKLGMTWSASSGSVYQLDDAGRPKGAAIFHVRMSEGSLLWTGVGGSSNGYKMMSHPGDSTVITCP